MTEYGPQMEVPNQVHAMKYRQENESFEELAYRMAAALQDNEEHRQHLKRIFLGQYFMPAGRIQSVVGSARISTPFNCYVSGEVSDDLGTIFNRVAEAAETMKQGGGIGYDFSLLRPQKDLISTLQSHSSGPVSFMEVFNTTCSVIAGAGHRRGAQMAVMRVNHPDIELFVRAKQKDGALTNFNVSVGVTDDFMQAVVDGTKFPLVFGGRTYKWVDARTLWDEIMRATWNWAEPGVLFLDTINRNNNLYYCETIAATNPCGEQPLPPFGACLLGSFNLTKYVTPKYTVEPVDDFGQGPEYRDGWEFDWEQFKGDIHHVVRAIDNVIDTALFPLPEQAREAVQKRRMGLGITGLANTLSALGYRYGSPEAIRFTEDLMYNLTDSAYNASVDLAKEKGAFPLYDERYLEGEFIQSLDEDTQARIRKHGIRNSHLISIAPCGTISFTADNISSGLEPVFAHVTRRPFETPAGSITRDVEDYAVWKWGIKAETTEDLSIDDHLGMLLAVVPYVDSAVSKTINIGDHVTFDEFKGVYMDAWLGGAKGLTTFRLAGKRFAHLTKVDDVVEQEGAACFFDPETMTKTCE